MSLLRLPSRPEDPRLWPTSPVAQKDRWPQSPRYRSQTRSQTVRWHQALNPRLRGWRPPDPPRSPRSGRPRPLRPPLLPALRAPLRGRPCLPLQRRLRPRGPLLRRLHPRRLLPQRPARWAPSRPRVRRLLPWPRARPHRAPSRGLQPRASLRACLRPRARGRTYPPPAQVRAKVREPQGRAGHVVQAERAGPSISSRSVRPGVRLSWSWVGRLWASWRSSWRSHC